MNTTSRQVEPKNDIEHVNTTQSVLSISPELFEKLYLTPKVHNSGEYRKRFANATPLGFMGFVVSCATFAMILMGWGGANSLNSVVGIFFFTGPLLLLLTTIFEWIAGNFFSMMVCGIFTVFWLSFGCLELPTWNIAASYSASGTNATEGAASVGYNAGLALYTIALGFTMFTFFLFCLRTNLVFSGIFFCTTIGVFCLSGAYWNVSLGNYDKAEKLQKAGAALLFVVALLGWYMTVVIMAAEMRISVKLPVGDLSRFWPKSDIDVAEMEKQA